MQKMDGWKTYIGDMTTLSKLYHQKTRLKTKLRYKHQISLYLLGVNCFVIASVYSSYTAKPAKPL